MTTAWELVATLAIGSHRDHILTRRAAEVTGMPLWYYADYPCLVYGEHNLSDWISAGPREFSVEVSPSGLKTWPQGFACQRSQIPLLFLGKEDNRQALAKYLSAG